MIIKLEKKDQSVKLIDSEVNKQILTEEDPSNPQNVSPYVSKFLQKRNQEKGSVSSNQTNQQNNTPSNQNKNSSNTDNNTEDEFGDVSIDDMIDDKEDTSKTDIYSKFGAKLDKSNFINVYLDETVPKKHFGKECTKFRVLNNTKTIDGHTLFQIVNVKSGVTGGYIEYGWNLGPFGESWIDESSAVYGNAVVWGDSQIEGNSIVFGDYQTRTVVNGKNTVISGSTVSGLKISKSSKEGNLSNEQEQSNVEATVRIVNSTIEGLNILGGKVTIENSKVSGHPTIVATNPNSPVTIKDSVVMEYPVIGDNVTISNKAVVSGLAQIERAVITNGAKVAGEARVYPEDSSSGLSKKVVTISGEDVVLKGARRYSTDIKSAKDVPGTQPSYARVDADGKRVDPFSAKLKGNKGGIEGLEYLVDSPKVFLETNEEYEKFMNLDSSEVDKILGIDSKKVQNRQSLILGNKLKAGWQSEEAKNLYNKLKDLGYADETDGWKTVSKDVRKLYAKNLDLSKLGVSSATEYANELMKQGRVLPDYISKPREYAHRSSDWYKNATNNDIENTYFIKRKDSDTAQS